MAWTLSRAVTAVADVLALAATLLRLGPLLPARAAHGADPGDRHADPRRA
ncbi:hypothetical protein ACIRL2_35125 [Embleya sp. NPDC127516]